MAEKKWYDSTIAKGANGKCPICGINTYTPENKPVIFPCGIEKCPWETEDDRKKIMETLDEEKIAGFLKGGGQGVFDGI